MSHSQPVRDLIWVVALLRSQGVRLTVAKFAGERSESTQEGVDKADRNGDGLICYKEVGGHNVI
jgi:hypothetical protein